MPYDAKFDSFTMAVNVIYNASHTHQKTKKTKQNNNNNNKKTKKNQPPQKNKKTKKTAAKDNFILLHYLLFSLLKKPLPVMAFILLEDNWTC